MSYGLVICSVCKREVHARMISNINSSGDNWEHCEDKSPRCYGASSIYPKSKDEIVGIACGYDDLPSTGSWNKEDLDAT